METTWIDKLREKNACKDAVVWAKRYPTIQEAWAVCKRGDWMIWLCRQFPAKANTKRAYVKLALAASESVKELCAHIPEAEVARKATQAWLVNPDSKTKKAATGAAAAADAAYAAYATYTAYAAFAAAAAIGAAGAAYATYAAYAAVGAAGAGAYAAYAAYTAYAAYAAFAAAYAAGAAADAAAATDAAGAGAYAAYTAAAAAAAAGAARTTKITVVADLARRYLTCPYRIPGTQASILRTGGHIRDNIYVLRPPRPPYPTPR